MKEALPSLFEKHTERGPSNALLFDEGMIEILKRTRDLRSRGRTLQQIREELAALPREAEEGSVQEGKEGKTTEPLVIEKMDIQSDGLRAALERENTLLRSQVTLLQTLLQKAEERFDRLLPEGKTQNAKSQLLMWLVEAVVVTAFATGFIFLIWFFAQKAFRLS
jgi:DNA-binding transcriptional MerR regulator